MRTACIATLLLTACHDGTAPADLGAMDAAAGADLATTLDLASACPRPPQPDDAPRAIIVSHPYAATTGSPASDWELLTLAATGAIAQPGLHFTMGRATSGTVVFTPDGELGFAAQEDGSIGVFRLRAGMPPEVVEAGHMRGFSAHALVVAPAGDVLYALDAETVDNHGGLYALPIGCDGTLGAETLLTAADVPYAIAALPAGQAALYARTMPGAPAGETAHRVTLGPPLARTAGAAAFPTAPADAIVASATLTHDGRYVLFGDNSEFASVPNRVAAIEVTASGLRAAQVLTPVKDPVALVASPFDNAALVVSGYDDAILGLDYDPSNASAPFTLRGPITYTGAKPQLPGAAVLVTRGALRGRVYVSENLGVRQVRFDSDGNIADLGRYPLGNGYAAIAGAIGVTP